MLAHQRQRLTASPSERAHIDAVLAELQYATYWRAFRLADLPPEIMTHILRLAAWSTATPAEAVIARLNLTWVSRDLRRAAISDCTLWNALWITDRAPYARTRAWLDRAGSAPLDIRFDETDPRYKARTALDEAGAEVLLSALRPKLAQLRMIIVVVRNVQAAQAVMRAVESAAPVGMERYEVHCAGRPFVSPEHGAWGEREFDRHGTTPIFCGGRLQHLALNGVHVNWVRSPISNLQSLDLRRMSLSSSPSLIQFRAMLSACPQLSKLALDGIGPQVDVNLARTLHPIVLPNVKTFLIGDFSLPYALYVLSQLRVPNVRDLTLMNLTDEDYTPLFATLTGQMKEVRLLTLYTIDVAPVGASRPTLVSWLRAMPLVRYLRIAQLQSYVFEALLDDPTYASEYPSPPPSPDPSSDSNHLAREVLCPQLNCLEFQHVSNNAVISVCEGRKELRRPLRTIYVNPLWAQDMQDEEVQRLKKVAEKVAVVDAYTTLEEWLAVQD